MASVLDIFNQALGHVGNSHRSRHYGSQDHQQCNRELLHVTRPFDVNGEYY